MNQPEEPSKGDIPFRNMSRNHLSSAVSDNLASRYRQSCFPLTHLGAKSLDFSWQVNDFRHKCESWDKYDNDLNALSVAHIKK